MKKLKSKFVMAIVLSMCLLMGLMPITASADGFPALLGPIKASVYQKNSANPTINVTWSKVNGAYEYHAKLYLGAKLLNTQVIKSNGNATYNRLYSGLKLGSNYKITVVGRGANRVSTTATMTIVIKEGPTKYNVGKATGLNVTVSRASHKAYAECNKVTAKDMSGGSVAADSYETRYSYRQNSANSKYTSWKLAGRSRGPNLIFSIPDLWGGAAYYLKVEMRAVKKNSWTNKVYYGAWSDSKIVPPKQWTNADL